MLEDIFGSIKAFSISHIRILLFNRSSAILLKMLCNFIEIGLRHGCSLVNLPHIFRKPFPKNNYGRLLIQTTRFFISNTKLELTKNEAIFSLIITSSSKNNRLILKNKQNRHGYKFSKYKSVWVWWCLYILRKKACIITDGNTKKWVDM